MPNALMPWQRHQADVKKTQLENLRRSLQLTDRILSERDNFLLRFAETKEDGSAMGHSRAVTLGNVTTIDVDKVPNSLGAAGIANILGLNYHELSHFMLSPADLGVFLPYMGTRAPRNWQGAYSILEEHRIETLMGARYPSMRKYFAHPILSLAIPNIKQDQVSTQHLLLHGRRYLPRKIRDTFAKFFEDTYGKGALADVNRLIDEYRFIPFNEKADWEKGAQVITKFARLLENLGIEPPPPQHSEKGQQSNGQPNAGNKAKERQDRQQMVQQAKQESEEQDEQEQDDPEYDGSEFGDDKQEEGEENERDDGDSGDDSDDESGDGSEEADSESGGSKGSEPTSDSGQDSGRGGQDQQGGGKSNPGKGEASQGRQNGNGRGDKQRGDSKQSSAGSGAGSSDKVNKSKPKQPETYNNKYEAAKAAAEYLEELANDEELQQDVQRYQDAMDQSQDGLRAMLGTAKEKHEKYLRQVTSEMFLRSGAVANTLRQIWARMESGWNYGVEDGSRLNMLNASLATEPEDYETIYDDWSPGQQDNSGLEVVILGDCSSSMSWTHVTTKDGQRGPALDTVVSQNIWELMYALQEVEAKVTVLTYDSDCYTFYDRSETVGTNGWYELEGGGGTSPLMAHEEARRILSGSEMPNKLLVNFTDGEWFGDKAEIAATLDPLWDVTKVAALLGGYSADQFTHRAAFDIVQNTSGDILDIMAEAVVDLLQKSGRN